MTDLVLRDLPALPIRARLMVNWLLRTGGWVDRELWNMLDASEREAVLAAVAGVGMVVILDDTRVRAAVDPRD